MTIPCTGQLGGRQYREPTNNTQGAKSVLLVYQMPSRESREDGFIPMTKTIVASRKNYTVEMLRTERELPETAIYVNTALDVLNPFPGLTFVPVSIYTDNGKYYGVVR